MPVDSWKGKTVVTYCSHDNKLLFEQILWSKKRQKGKKETFAREQSKEEMGAKIGKWLYNKDLRGSKNWRVDPHHCKMLYWAPNENRKKSNYPAETCRKQIAT